MGRLCDAFCTNTHYAKVGGISTSELNVLELEMLVKLNWNILVTDESLQRYYVNLSLQSPKYLRQAEADNVNSESTSVTRETTDLGSGNSGNKLTQEGTTSVFKESD